MKRLNLAMMALVVLLTYSASAQQSPVVSLSELPPLNIAPQGSLHLISSEDIQYVDISSNVVAGDLPLPNLLRLKLLDTLTLGLTSRELGALTVVGDNFIAQYRLITGTSSSPAQSPVMIEIAQEHLRPLEISTIALSRSQLRILSTRLLAEASTRPVRRTEAYGIGIVLNRLNAVGDYIFMDLTFSNSSNLPYSVDQLRFFIGDRKIVKATNVQQVEIEPLFQLQGLSEFKQKHRNVFVIKKATFPGHKVLRISLTEKQISGRTVELEVGYREILRADSF